MPAMLKLAPLGYTTGNPYGRQYVLGFLRNYIGVHDCNWSVVVYVFGREQKA